jgi:hypothetical protein
MFHRFLSRKDRLKCTTLPLNGSDPSWECTTCRWTTWLAPCGLNVDICLCMFSHRALTEGNGLVLRHHCTTLDIQSHWLSNKLKPHLTEHALWTTALLQQSKRHVSELLLRKLMGVSLQYFCYEKVSIITLPSSLNAPAPTLQSNNP